jgi:hypothetical protein
MSIKGSWQRPDGDRKKFDEEYDRIFNKKNDDIAEELSLSLHDMYKGGETPEMYYELTTNEQEDLGDCDGN